MSVLEKKRINHPRWDESELPKSAILSERDLCIYTYGQGHEDRVRVRSVNFDDFEWIVVREG